MKRIVTNRLKTYRPSEAALKFVLNLLHRQPAALLTVLIPLTSAALSVGFSDTMTRSCLLILFCVRGWHLVGLRWLACGFNSVRILLPIFRDRTLCAAFAWWILELSDVSSEDLQAGSEHARAHAASKSLRKGLKRATDVGKGRKLKVGARTIWQCFGGKRFKKVLWKLLAIQL